VLLFIRTTFMYY